MKTICDTCRYRHGVKGNHKESPCVTCDPDALRESKYFWKPVPLIMRPLYRALDWLQGWMDRTEEAQ